MIQERDREPPAKTGRSSHEWIAHIRKHGPKGERPARVLKKAHGLGTNYAGWLAEARRTNRGRRSRQVPRKFAERYVDEMFASGKAGDCGRPTTRC